jgi:hypothetical protein
MASKNDINFLKTLPKVFWKEEEAIGKHNQYGEGSKPIPISKK